MPRHPGERPRGKTQGKDALNSVEYATPVPVGIPRTSSILPGAALISMESYLIAGGALIALLVIGWLLSRKRGSSAPRRQPKLTIDVAALGDHTPPRGEQLTIYNTPVWLAAVVIAPAGRDRALPTPQTVPALTDHAIPGLQEVMLQRRTKIFVWPAQLSSRGFAHSFYREAALPGDGGKGTPWCSLAGTFHFHGAGYVLGLICRAERANNLGQYTIEQDRNWLDIARTSTAGS